MKMLFGSNEVIMMLISATLFTGGFMILIHQGNTWQVYLGAISLFFVALIGFLLVLETMALNYRKLPKV